MTAEAVSQICMAGSASSLVHAGSQGVAPAQLAVNVTAHGTHLVAGA